MAEAWDPEEALKEMDGGGSTSAALSSGVDPKSNSGLDYLLKAAGYVGNHLMNPVGKGWQEAGMVASGGRWLNNKIQSGIGEGVEAAGRLGGQGVGDAAALAGAGVGTAAEYLIPQNELGVLAMAPALGKLAGSAERAAQEAQRASGKAAMLRPDLGDKTLGQMASARSAVRPEYASEAIADPSILGDKTLPKSEVSKMFQAYLNKMGAKVGPEKMKEFSGSMFPAGENEVGRLEKMTEGVLERIRAGENVPLEDAFLARQAASRLTVSEKAKRMPEMRRTAAKLEQEISDYMEKIGGGEVKELNRLWRRASIKEAFGHALPQNKNMSPNALRAFAMGQEFLNSGEALLNGDFGRAGMRALSGATMSPLILGQFIKGASPLGQAGAASTAGPLAEMFREDKGKKRGR
jgi:hypothetical protein